MVSIEHSIRDKWKSTYFAFDQVRSARATFIYAVLILVALVHCQLDESEFNIGDDLKIDSPAIIPSLNPSLPMGPFASGGSVGDDAPRSDNVYSDMSGLGLLGKMHPNVVVNDKIVRAYHNRMHDPRYVHLQGYGKQDQNQASQLGQNKNNLALEGVEDMKFFKKWTDCSFCFFLNLYLFKKSQ